MDIDAYLRRIGYEGPRDATPAALWAIARCHAFSIAFENLAVLAHGAPELDAAQLERKLVTQRRGGYCYEQNGLLLHALAGLGFAVEGLSARVRYGVPPEQATARSHMVLLVRFGERRAIADAGFGSITLTSPLWLRMGEEQSTSHETLRVVPVAGDYLLQVRLDSEWRDVYRFDLVPQLDVDYVQQNWYTATRPGSLFGNNLVVARPDATGRATLFNRTLTRRARDGATDRRTVGDIGELREVLRDIFGLAIPQEELEVAWQASGRGAASHPVFG